MVDVHQSGDYPIVLGDSLKDDTSSSSSHIGLRYNWIPKSGLDKNTGRIIATSDGLSLTYDLNGEILKYAGWQSERSDTDHNHQLALFYDSSRSAFVLEKLSATLDFNLRSGTHITPDHIARHAQIVKLGRNATETADGDPLHEEAGDGSPDDSNPFDYRHFLAEAKETADKANHTGNRTPLPGGRTPMSGLSSPMAGHPFQSTTPQFGPIEIIDASHIEDGPEWGDRQYFKKSNKQTKSTRRANVATTRPKTQISPPSKQTQPRPKVLSSERVQDSSDSDSDASAQPSLVTQPKSNKNKKPTPNKKSQPPSRSPAIVVNNDSDSGGLEIDTGSPPPTTSKRGYKIDAEAFRSQTGTPAITRPVSRQSNADIDIDMPDADEDDEEFNKYLQPASDSDEDMENSRQGGANADVDELILDDGSDSPDPAPPPKPASRSIPPPPPPPKRSSVADVTLQAPIAQRATKTRRQSSTISRASRTSKGGTSRMLDKEKDKQRFTSRSPSPIGEEPEEDEDDDDEYLTAALEDAIRERESHRDREDESGVGLGIGVDVDVDEESDISEEE